MRAAILIVLSLGIAGCGDDCHEGESQCDGAQIRTCDEGDIGGYTFRGQGDCCAGSTCIDALSGSDRVAACSDSPSPDPRCGMFGNVCADPTTLLECRYGYSRAVEACTGTCVDPGDGHAFCALVATDARCAGVTPYGSMCAVSTLVHCNAGALLDETACAAACVDRGQGHAFCSTSTLPDPRCPAMVAWCDNNVAMECTAGGFVAVDMCAASAPCMVATLPDGSVLSAFCNAPPPPPNACAADQ